MSLLVLPQHEQFYPERTSVVAPFPLVWITLAPKFKAFLAMTAIFKDFQRNVRTLNDNDDANNYNNN